MLDILSRVRLLDIEDRLVYRKGQWFIRTREIQECGPFDSRLEAVEGLFRHVAVCTGRLNHCDHKSARAFIRHSVRTCTEPSCELCADLMAVLPFEPAVQAQLKA